MVRGIDTTRKHVAEFQNELTHMLNSLKDLDHKLQEVARHDNEVKQRILKLLDSFQQNLAPTLKQTFSAKFTGLRKKIEKLVEEDEAILDDESWKKVVKVTKGSPKQK